jgi:hypothetical protein
LALTAGLVVAILAAAGPALALGTWRQEATGGLGNPNNTQAWSQAVYQSKLFIGTVNIFNGLEIYAFDGDAWNLEVGLGGPVAAGFGNAANVAAACMAVYGDCLYVGTGTLGGLCEVWRYDGNAWTPVVGGASPVPAGFGNPNIDAMNMCVYGLELYVGTRNNPNGCELWRYDGTNWAPVVGGTSPMPAGFGSANNNTTRSLVGYGPFMYAGTENGVTGCEVWRFDGTTWIPVVGGAAPVGPGFGNAANTAAMGMAAYAGMLFAGTQNGGGCEVWAYDGTAWVQVVGALPSAVIGPGFGNPANFAIRPMHAYDSKLFAGTANMGGCELWSLDANGWKREVGGGAAGTPTGPGFGDANNTVNISLATFSNRLYAGTTNQIAGCQLYSFDSSTTWYLAEGATAGGFETWVLVQNPNPTPVNVTLSFQTGAGLMPGPVDTIPGNSRRSYLVDTYVDTFDVSTMVAADSDVVCERAMYWTPEGSTVRSVGHDSIGVVNPASTWYMAEGATKGGFETWVLVQNPNPGPVNVDVKFQTDTGEVQGPQETLPGFTRKSWLVDAYVDTFDVSTRVDSYMGDVVCERAVYFTPDGYTTRQVGHDSIGVVSPAYTWYLAEGATAGGFETWVLVQNPNDTAVNIDMKFQTNAGEVQGPVDGIPARSRKSYLVDAWTDTYDVSTRVSSTGGAVICERAMYESPTSPGLRLLGHDSIGTTVGGLEWFLAEGATASGFETWVLVQNPNSVPVTIDMKFQTGGGEVQGPVDTIPAFSRKSYLVDSWVDTDDVSTKVTSTAGGNIICERAVYWRPHPDAVRYLGTDSIGYKP